MRKFFLTFADKRFAQSLTRIGKQAAELAVFDQIILANEDHLDADFRARFADKLTAEHRGFGYWCWKPQMIKQTLRQMEDGDVLIYGDSGNWVNRNGLMRLYHYFDLVANDHFGLIAFEHQLNGNWVEALDPTIIDFLNECNRIGQTFREYKLVKSSLLFHLGLDFDSPIYHTPQLWAGCLIMQKRAATLQFVADWQEPYFTDFGLIDDSPSSLPNHPDFGAHRHDQAIYSLLAKINQVTTIPDYFYFKSEFSSRLKLLRTPDLRPTVAEIDPGLLTKDLAEFLEMNEIFAQLFPIPIFAVRDLR